MKFIPIVVKLKKNQHHYVFNNMILQKSFIYTDLMFQKHFLLLSMLKTVVLLNMFVETDINFLKN